MRASLPIFAALVGLAVLGRAWAQDPPLGRFDVSGSAPPSADSISPAALVQRMLAAINDVPSISAKVRFKVNLAGQSWRGSGLYLQQGRGVARQIRFVLETDVDGRVHRQQQICDGQRLWIVDEQEETKTVAQIEIERVRTARPKGARQASPVLWLGLGGMPKLLTSIEGEFAFAPVAMGRLGELPVWIIDGQWKPSQLTAMLPDQRATIESGGRADTTKLAPNVPDRVVLHAGCDDFLLYRIEYWRATAPPTAGALDRGALLLVMELYEVSVGGPIDPQQFAYDPGKATVVDRTASFLESQGMEETAPVGAGPAAPRR